MKNKNIPTEDKSRPHNILHIPPIDKYSSRAEWEKACWLSISKSKTIIEKIITPDERHAFVMRVECIERLLAGKSYKDIGKELWLSPQTISSVAHGLKNEKYLSYKKPTKAVHNKNIKNDLENTKKRKRHKDGRPFHSKYGTIYW